MGRPPKRRGGWNFERKQDAGSKKTGVCREPLHVRKLLNDAEAFLASKRSKPSPQQEHFLPSEVRRKGWAQRRVRTTGERRWSTTFIYCSDAEQCLWYSKSNTAGHRLHSGIEIGSTEGLTKLLQQGDRWSRVQYADILRVRSRGALAFQRSDKGFVIELNNKCTFDFVAQSAEDGAAWVELLQGASATCNAQSAHRSSSRREGRNEARLDVHLDDDVEGGAPSTSKEDSGALSEDIMDAACALASLPVAAATSASPSTTVPMERPPRPKSLPRPSPMRKHIRPKPNPSLIGWGLIGCSLPPRAIKRFQFKAWRARRKAQLEWDKTWGTET